MRNLIDFIFKNVHWLLFIALLSVAIVLISNNHQFQRSKYLAAAHEVTGNIYNVTHTFRSYLNLKSQNRELAEKITELQTELYNYQRVIDLQDDSLQTMRIKLTSDSALVYRSFPARVVNNSVSKTENYITLNKGSLDAVRADMGVMTAKGVVGVVMNTSPHFSTVISILNPKFQLSGKIKGSNYAGPLVWDGKDSRYTYLTKIPRHAEYQTGDTIVTSGYSSVFPAGLPVGTIVGTQKETDDSYRSIRVHLFADMADLGEAMIVVNGFQHEQKELENKIK
ncbi:MAG: rod shape-determining protein MreC [Dysgonamonadaceae bacterium]|nr:rod shape-determining protein MreC [Dysgonamonadaceae bacterium]